jgi:tRNA (cmo5U34)-methyltransferase
MNDIAQFFNDVKDEYTESVQRSNPCYAEMLGALLGYLPADCAPNAILELGCGTGNLTLLLRDKFPGAHLLGIDISEGSLEVCQKRLGAKPIELRNIDMRLANFENAKFDIVVSGLSLHHLVDAERQALYQSVHNWLRDGGWFIFCDRFCDESVQVTQINRKLWQEGAFSRGTTEAEWNKWMKHEVGHDHPGILIQQAEWIKERGGFATSDVVWRKYLWAVIYAQK